jgi:predicted anti-sigma-YlaC factor YlaD
MKHHGREQIQRYLDGLASREEVAVLQAALREDSVLRALYLDYMNLDVALAAAAEAATVAENGSRRIAVSPRLPARTSSRYGRWLAVTAACAALIVFALLFRDGHRRQQHPNINADFTATKEAIARLSIGQPASFPAWVSPTASLLDQPHFTKGDL